MGKEYFRRPISTPEWVEGQYVKVSTAAATGAAAALTLNSSIGVHFLTYGSSGNANDFILQQPERAGQEKKIWITKETSSEEFSIFADPVTALFTGTTYNTITVAAGSTTHPAGTPFLQLTAQSTTTWAVSPGSTFDFDFTKTTGSTDQ